MLQDSNSNSTTIPLESQLAPPPKPELNIRRDYYQTESDVVLNILAKNTKRENLKVVFEAERIQIHTKLSDGSDYSLSLRLFRPINHSACSSKVLGTKIEIKMRKMDSSTWTALEATEESETEILPCYPSSSKTKKNWDKLEKEIEKDTENDDPSNAFSMLYKHASDDAKRAMVKSMQESGGTVLSTDWNSVGQKTTEMSPPDGMEFKKWDS